MPNEYTLVIRANVSGGRSSACFDNDESRMIVICEEYREKKKCFIYVRRQDYTNNEFSRLMAD